MICENGHLRIQYDLSYWLDCPVCAARRQVVALESKLKERELTIDRLMERLDMCRRENQALREPLLGAMLVAQEVYASRKPQTLFPQRQP